MQVVDFLSPSRVQVDRSASPLSKAEVLRELARLLCERSSPEERSLVPDEVEANLIQREAQQSTGVGGGVAFPHAAVERLEHLRAAVLICGRAVAFDAHDGEPVGIFVAVISPRKDVGLHLKTLARLSRILRDDAFRDRLRTAAAPQEVYDLLVGDEVRSP